MSTLYQGKYVVWQTLTRSIAKWTKWRNDRLSCSEIFDCGSLTKLDGDALACVTTKESLRYLAEPGSTYERAFNINPDS